MGLDQTIIKCNARDIGRDDGQIHGEEVACFRKANALHAWILRTYDPEEDNCVPIPLKKEDVEKLAKDLDKVLASRDKKNGKSIALKLFPSMNGFFFGPTDIDDGYYTDVEDVAIALDNMLNDWEYEDGYLYWAWY